MKKMKRILSLVLVLVMAAALPPAAEDTSGAGSSTPAEPAGSQGAVKGMVTMWLFRTGP
ncbi:MAG: hypothetical protein ACLRZH_01870 [Ruthenibacterium lactatiformans]